MAVKIYRRGDGVEFHAEAGSPTDQMMAKSGEFELLSVDGEDVVTEHGDDVAGETGEPAAAPAPRPARKRAAKK